MSQELAPCPFCNDAMRVEDKGYLGQAVGHSLDNAKCFLSGLLVPIGAWNRRAQPTGEDPLPSHLLPFHDVDIWKQRDDLVRECLELRAEVKHWKANHDNMVEHNRQLKERPDLGDRAKAVEDLRTALKEWETLKGKIARGEVVILGVRK